MRVIPAFFLFLFWPLLNFPVFADDVDVIPTIQVQNTQQNNRIADSTSAPVWVVTAAQIKASGAQNISDVLRQFSSIQLQDLTGDGSQVAISIRGFGDNASSNALILIDGVPFDNNDLGTPQLSLILIEDIAKIEIIPGSEGSLLGDQAVGGVVYITTKTGQLNQKGLQAEWGSQQGRALYGFASQNNSSWQDYFSGKLYTSNNFRDHNRDNQGNLYGHVTKILPDGDFSLMYDFHHQYLLFAGALNATQVLENPDLAQNNSDFSRDNQLFIHAQDHLNLSPEWQLITDASGRNDTDNVVLTLPFAQNRQDIFLQSKLIGTWQHFVLTSGLSSRWNDYTLLGFSPSTNSDSQQSDAFILGKFMPIPKLATFLGTRVAGINEDFIQPQNMTDHDQVWVHTEGLRYQITSHLKWYLRRDGNFRFPKVDEQLFIPTNETLLQTQTGVSYETGLDWQQSRWQASLYLFRLDLNNEIAFDPTQTPTQPFGANRNLDPTQRDGIMATAAYAVTTDLTLSGNATWLNPQFRSGPHVGNQIPFVAKQVYETSIDEQVNPYWNLHGEIVYTGSRYPFGDNANQAQEEPPLMLLNFASNFHWQQFFAQVRINNLTNTFYNAISTLQSITEQQFYYPGPGRSVWITLGVTT